MAPILQTLEEFNAPMTVRDVVRETGIPRPLVNRALARLHSRGLVERYKIPMPSVTPAGKPCVREYWCYQFIVEDEE